jgi:hypothetical protein
MGPFVFDLRPEQVLSERFALGTCATDAHSSSIVIIFTMSLQVGETGYMIGHLYSSVTSNAPTVTATATFRRILVRCAVPCSFTWPITFISIVTEQTIPAYATDGTIVEPLQPSDESGFVLAPEANGG